MQKINFTEFKKKVIEKGNYQALLLNGYFDIERWSTKMVYISNQVEEVTSVMYRNREACMIFPDKGSVYQSLQPYFELIQRFIKVQEPVISIFDMNGKKIVELNKPIEISAS